MTRNISILGEEGVKKLRNAFVIVVGLGGVGSNVAHQLARAGVGHLRLIDFDQISLSSLNRHATATRNDVGTPKSIALKSHLLKILPHLNIDARNELFSPEKASELLSGTVYQYFFLFISGRCQPKKNSIIYRKSKLCS